MQLINSIYWNQTILNLDGMEVNLHKLSLHWDMLHNILGNYNFTFIDWIWWYLWYNFHKGQLRITEKIKICSADAMTAGKTDNNNITVELVGHLNYNHLKYSNKKLNKIRKKKWNLTRSCNTLFNCNKITEFLTIISAMFAYLATPISKSLSCLPHSHQSGKLEDGWASCSRSSNFSWGKTLKQR